MLAAKYWWVSIPIAFAIWSRVKERKARGELQAFNVVSDIGMIVTPAISLVMLSELMMAKTPADATAVETTAAAVSGLAGPQRVINASFTPHGHRPMQMPMGAVPIPEMSDNPMSSILGSM